MSIHKPGSLTCWRCFQITPPAEWPSCIPGTGNGPAAKDRRSSVSAARAVNRYRQGLGRMRTRVRGLSDLEAALAIEWSIWSWRAPRARTATSTALPSFWLRRRSGRRQRSARLPKSRLRFSVQFDGCFEWRTSFPQSADTPILVGAHGGRRCSVEFARSASSRGSLHETSWSTLAFITRRCCAQRSISGSCDSSVWD
jgi:hypothetical protein